MKCVTFAPLTMKTKVYTKGGDKGKTVVPLKGTIAKSENVVQALGDVDELNCHIGLLREKYSDEMQVGDFLAKLQNALFALGSQVSCGINNIKEENVLTIEAEIDKLDEQLPPLSDFILPVNPADIHLARAVCRRAERRIIAFNNSDVKQVGLLEMPIKYLNRLSDYLFVLARYISKNDIIWDKNGY